MDEPRPSCWRRDMSRSARLWPIWRATPRRRKGLNFAFLKLGSVVSAQRQGTNTCCGLLWSEEPSQGRRMLRASGSGVTAPVSDPDVQESSALSDRRQHPSIVIGALGLVQIVAWGSSYYLIAV